MNGPPRTPHARLSDLAVIGLILMAGIALWPALSRAGYSSDEDLTIFAVRGISRHSLPLLPSGLLYERGMLFTYACWAAGAILGHTVVVYRTVSALAALAGLYAVSAVARRTGGPTAAVLAVLLIASSPSFVAVAQWARFYSFLFVFYLLAILSFMRGVSGRDRGAYLVCVALARLSHEWAWTLAAVPAVSCLLEREKLRVRSGVVVSLVWTLVVLMMVELVLYALQAAVPVPWAGTTPRPWSLPLGDAFTVPSTLHLLPLSAGMWLAVLAALVAAVTAALYTARIGVFVAAVTVLSATLQLGGLLFAFALVTLRRPEHTWRYVRAVILASLLSLILWTAAVWATTSARLSLELPVALASYALSYPAAGIFFLRVYFPLGLLTSLAGCWLCLRSSAAPAGAERRLLACLFIVWLIVIGVSTTGFEPRMLLILTVLMLLVVSAIPAMAEEEARRRVRYAGTVSITCAVALAAALVAEHSAAAGRFDIFADEVEGARRVTPVRKTLVAGSSADLKRVIRSTESVICTDELACLLILGRVDYWLAVNEHDVAQFAVPTASGIRSIYTGNVVIPGADSLNRLIAGRPGKYWIFLVNSAKFEKPQAGTVKMLPNSYIGQTVVHDDAFSSMIVVDSRPAVGERR